jgi:membrane protease subunit HflK
MKAVTRSQRTHKKLIQDILDRYQTGIQIHGEYAEHPATEQVQAAFDDAVKPVRIGGRKRGRLCERRGSKACGTASCLAEEANGYRQRLIAMADGDASRFRQILSEYNKAPGSRDSVVSRTMAGIQIPAR